MTSHFATLPHRGGRRRSKRAQPPSLEPVSANATAIPAADCSDIDNAASTELFHALLDAGIDERFAQLNRRLRRVVAPSELAGFTAKQLRGALVGLSAEDARRLRQRLAAERRRRAASLMGRMLRRLLPGGPPMRPAAPANFVVVGASTLPSASSSGPSPAGQTAPSIARHCLRLASQLSPTLRQASWLLASSAAVPVALRTKTADKDCQAEIDRLASLKHRSIARLLGAADPDGKAGRVWLVMELAPFGSLLDCLRERRLRAQLHPGALCHLAQQLAEAMSYLENRGQPHGRLSPGSVLVFALDRIKLAHSELDSARSAPSQGEVWLAPEQSSSAAPSIAADVWSFGVTLWQMFAYGEVPPTKQPALTRPTACPARLYNEVMQHRCWQPAPHLRATFNQLALHLPKILPERRLAVRHHPQGSPLDLGLQCGDVVIVLDDSPTAGGSDASGWLGVRLASSSASLLDDDKDEDGVVSVGRFDPGATTSLTGGVAANAASAPSTAPVTRRATLGTSYAREFGHRISVRFRKAAQSRLQPQAQPLESDYQPAEQSAAQPRLAADSVSDASSEILRRQSRRRRVTSDMISEPCRSEFRHAGHVGADGTVFGDVSCLAELELTPTCEPPAPPSPPPPPPSAPSAPQPPTSGPHHEFELDTADNASSVVYRRTPRQVDNLREQSGYCRLGSSLSLGVESIAAASSNADDCQLDIGDDSEDPDWMPEAGSSTDGLAGDSGMSLIDEILRAWGSAVQSAAHGDPEAVTEAESDGRNDLSAADNQKSATNDKEFETNDRSDNSRRSSSQCSRCCAADCCVESEVKCDENNSASPSTSVSSLNGAAEGATQKEPEPDLEPEPKLEPEQLQQQPPPSPHSQQKQRNCTSVLFQSSPISLSPCCSSGVSSLDSLVPHQAEAAAHMCHSPQHLLCQQSLAMPIAATAGFSVIQTDRSHADSADEEDIVDM